MTNGNRDIKSAARELQLKRRIRYTEALRLVEEQMAGMTPEQRDLSNMWKAYLNNVLNHYEDSYRTPRLSDIKIRPFALKQFDEDVAAIQVYIETLSGDLYLSNEWDVNKEPSIVNMPSKGMMRLVQKTSNGMVLDVSVPMTPTRDYQVYRDRFFGMVSLATYHLNRDGKGRLSDIAGVMNQSDNPDEIHTWEQFSKAKLFPIGMQYNFENGIQGGIYDARYGVFEEHSNQRIFVTRADYKLTDNDRYVGIADLPKLGKFGTEDLIVWVPVGDGKYTHTLPLEAEGRDTNSYANWLSDILQDVQLHGQAMAAES